MEIVIQRTYEDLCDEAFRVLRQELLRKPGLALGLATGRTPAGLYRRIVDAKLPMKRVRFFNLDEFIGLPPSDPRSFHHLLHERLLDPLKIPERNAHLLRGDVPDPEKAAVAYEKVVRAAGGIDLQILGIGRNGHVAFNEPGSSLGSRTRPKTLEMKTLVDYAGTFASPDEVPRFSITMGIGTILEARRILLLASGPEKAEAIQRMAEGPITAEIPASALQLHPKASVLLDEDAASRLIRKDYWKWVYANKWRVGQ